MSFQRAAEIQVVLEGVPLPASRGELIAYARGEDPAAAEALAAITDRMYDRLDDVGEALLRTAPVRQHADSTRPEEESGAPPGGDDYLVAR